MLTIKVKNHHPHIFCLILLAITMLVFSPVYIDFENKHTSINIFFSAFGVYFLLAEAFRLYKISETNFLSYDMNKVTIYDPYDQQEKIISLRDIKKLSLTNKTLRIVTSNRLFQIQLNMMTKNDRRFFLANMYPMLEKNYKMITNAHKITS